MNKHTVKEFKRELDRLIRDSERLAFLLDSIENGEFELITRVHGGGHRTLSFQEIETMLEGWQ